MSKSYLLLAAAVLMSIVVGLARAEAALQASVVCEAEPVEKGLQLDRAGISAATVNVGGQETACWVSRHKSVPEDDWARSFRMKITDDRFREGKTPSVDIEVTYMLEANTKVELLADTATGSRVIAAGWGNKREWQTLRCRVTDAFFGSRNPGNDPKKLPVDGFDLRFNGWAGDLHLRSVVVRGHDPKRPDDWSQFLNLEATTAREQLIVKPGDASKLTFKLANRAAAEADLTVTYAVLDGVGKKVGGRSEPLLVPAAGSADLSYEFDTRNVPPGEYSLRVTAATRADAKTAAAVDQPVVVAGPNDAFIVFDKTPIMQGMDFDRTAIEPKQIEVDGVKRWVWSAGFGSQRGGDGWWNSVSVTMTDPRFQNARSPVVDLTLNYRHEPNAPLTLFADTASGSRQVGFGWGRNPGWQSMRGQIDDARFNRTDYQSNPKDLRTDGFDLRFNACSGNAEIRSIFVHAYDLDTSPDYRRLLRFDGVDAGRELNVFAPGEKQDLTIKLRNLANVPADAVYSVSLVDDLSNVIWTRGDKTSIRHGEFVIPVAFDAGSLKQGAYTVNVEIDRDTSGKRERVFTSSTDLLVAEPGAIAKAGPGEFLYGVDPGVGFEDDRFFQWMNFMGADITRGNGANSDATQWPAAFAQYKKHGLKASVFFDIPWDADANARAAKVKRVAEIATAAVKAHGDDISYIELGNEPDLDFFYPGPIEQYVEGYSIVARAIKAAKPDAIVMNGGLSFSGVAGDRRSRKFIELVPPGDIDVIAFHGHGPGVGAERSAYERARAAAQQYGKGDKPMMDTESGVAASTPAQLRVQARTAVQKQVYAQSVGLKALMWFRLLITGGDEAYTNLKNVHEPRPAILSFRTMVRNLRGLKLDRALSAKSADQEIYLFAQPGGERRVLVTWANTRGGDVQLLKIASVDTAVRDCAIVDLFGNRRAMPVSSDGIVAVPIDLDPAYLAWSSNENAVGVTLVNSPLGADAQVSLTPGAADRFKVSVTNSLDKPLQATLAVSAAAGAGVELPSPQQTVTVAPRSTQRFDIPATLTARADRVSWPQRWTVFTGVPSGAIDLSTYKEIPSQIVAGGKTFAPQVVHLRDGKIDFAAIGGGFAEKKEAIAFAVVTAPADGMMRVGASADWWMDWFANGAHAWGNLDSGNGTGQYTVLDHTFEVPVKAGANLLAVRVLSGSQGWKLVSGGPEEIASAKASTAGEGRALTVELRQNDVLLGRRRLTITPRNLIAPLTDGVRFDGDLGAWDKLDPQGDLTETGVVNEWSKQPDATKWWKGEKDLSGRVWLRSDADRIYVVAAIADDVHRPARTAADIDNGDSFRVALATDGGNVQHFAIASGAVFVAGEKGTWVPADTAVATAIVDRVDASGTTWYRLSLARSVATAGPVAINVLVNDDDFGGHKQSCTWFPGITDPASARGWWQGVFPSR